MPQLASSVCHDLRTVAALTDLPRSRITRSHVLVRDGRDNRLALTMRTATGVDGDETDNVCSSQLWRRQRGQGFH
jgi:hypothetical protein